jgi:hypothetical protein
MIDKLAELNRVLLAVRDLVDTEGFANVKAVIEHCKSPVIEARIPNHETSISFAEQIGLLTTRGAAVGLTENGSGFADLNPGSLYDLSEGQKKLLLRICYLHGPLRKQAMGILKEFSQALGSDALRWSIYDSSPLPDEWAAEHLNQLGLLRRHDDGWEVSAEYTNTVAVFLEEGEGWSEEKFKEYLKEKEEVGKLGEDLVKAFEARRLTRMGHVVEARCIRRISNVRVNAGYDIESFDGPSPAVNYDRFIEVKAARGPKMHFFWSQNEIQVATRLGERYWIYFQGAVDVAKGIARNEPLMLQNPAKSVLQDGEFKTTPHGLIVEANRTGSPIGKH